MRVSCSDWLGYNILRARIGYILRARSSVKAFRFSSRERERERTSTTTLTMHVYKNMTREHSLGADRSLVVKRNGDVYTIMIFEMGFDNRRLEFPLVRWSSFTRAFDEIDIAVNDLKTNHQFKNSSHISGGYHVSVTGGYWCFDISYKQIIEN